MNLKTLITFFTLMLCVLDVFAQNVTFSGTVSRHELSDLSPEVSGTVHIRFGFPTSDGPDSDVLVPFTIPANQTSVQYSKTVPWSLVDNDPDGFYDYFTIDVSCINNCSAAKLSEEIAHYSEAHSTISGYSTNSSYAERFGEDQRNGGYTVNLTLLPNFGVISGQFSLPNGQSAKQDIELFAVAIDDGGSGYSRWIQVLQQKVVIKTGNNTANFQFLINENELAYGRRRNTSFGYSCRSSACSDHGLIERGWLQKDMRNVSTNDAKQDSFNLIMSDAKAFSVELPSPITLLPMRQTDIIVPRISSAHSTPEKIEGKIIVEKLDFILNCTDFMTTPFDWDKNIDSVQCYENSVAPRTVTVSETPFSIPASQTSAIVTINIEPMSQLTSTNEFIENQRIRFECDSGCESTPYIKKGYFQGFAKRFATPSADFAYKFKQTSDYENKDIILSLHKPPLLVSVYNLLLEE